MLRRFAPQTVVQELAIAAGAAGVAATGVCFIDYSAGMYPAGLAVGLWVAALWSDLRGT